MIDRYFFHRAPLETESGVMNDLAAADVAAMVQTIATRCDDVGSQVPPRPRGRKFLVQLAVAKPLAVWDPRMLPVSSIKSHRHGIDRKPLPHEGSWRPRQ